MNWDVTAVTMVDNNILQVYFKDGVTGLVKCLSSFFRGLVALLCDPVQFRQVILVGGIVTRPSKLDLAPDAMHAAIKERSEWVLV